MYKFLRLLPLILRVSQGSICDEGKNNCDWYVESNQNTNIHIICELINSKMFFFFFKLLKLVTEKLEFVYERAT